MTLTVVEYGGASQQIKGCGSFEFRCNYVTNWITIKKSNGTQVTIKDISVIKGRK